MLDLTGCTIWLTRPAGQAVAWQQLLSDAGARVLVEPLLCIDPPEDPDTAAAGLDRAVQADYVIATSANAVVSARRLRPGWSPRGHLLAIGATTAEALANATGRAVATPHDARSEGVLEMPMLSCPAGKRVAILGGEQGRTVLAESLRARGARVDKLALYRRRPAAISNARIDALLQQADIVIVTSAEAWQHLFSLTAGRRRARLARLRLVAASQRVVKQASQNIDWFVEPAVIGQMDAASMLAALGRIWSGQRE